MEWENKKSPIFDLIELYNPQNNKMNILKQMDKLKHERIISKWNSLSTDEGRVFVDVYFEKLPKKSEWTLSNAYIQAYKDFAHLEPEFQLLVIENL